MVDSTTAPHQIESPVVEREVLDRRLVKSNAFADSMVCESRPVVLQQMLARIGGVYEIVVTDRLRKQLGEPRRAASCVKNPIAGSGSEPLDDPTVGRLVKTV